MYVDGDLGRHPQAADTSPAQSVGVTIHVLNIAYPTVLIYCTA